MKSKVLAIYKTWLASATPEQIEFADQVYSICEEHYESGGDRIVECWEPKDVLEFFILIQPRLNQKSFSEIQVNS